jgi:Kef-type K+ transport system membrane component KefB
MVAAVNFGNLVAVLAVAAAVPLLLAAVPRVRVPGPVLEIAAGIVLGPAVLNLVKPDQAVRLVSTIGLAFLLFLAGLEIDVRHFRGPRAGLAGLALALSVLLALIIGVVLHAAGVVGSPLLVGIILLATSLGLIVPILEDAGVADRPVGQFAIAGASLGELSPVVLLSLFFSGRATAIGPKLLLLSLLGVLAVLVVIGTLRIERSMWITRMINRLADTSAQIRIRLSVLLVVGLGALATHLGFEAILGAFIAGAILRLVDADAEHKHPLFHPKLDAIGYGFLIPVFFVTSGLTFNLAVLFSSASTLLRVPLFLLALLVVRGLPAVLYRPALPSIRDVAAVGLLQATSLPFIAAATTIGLQLHAITPANAAALVAAGLLSVIIFPITALQLLRSPAQDPNTVPDQAHAR